MKSTIALLSLLLTGALAQADPFVYAPESFAPVWQTHFPYQRNINMDFSVSPAVSPGPGIPGADYEGTYDSTLKVSDGVAFAGAAQWYNSLAGIAGSGFIGIDNRLGTTLLTGSVSFDLDNLLIPNPAKHLWAETVYSETQVGNLVFQVTAPANYTSKFIGDLPVQDLQNGFFRYDAEWGITPNPCHETVTLNFSVAAGQYAIVDGLHLATECVPEPGTETIALAFLGMLALRNYRLRR